MTKEKANRNEVVGMFLTYCRKTLVNARTDVLREPKGDATTRCCSATSEGANLKALRTGRTCRSGKPYSMPPESLSA